MKKIVFFVLFIIPLQIFAQPEKPETYFYKHMTGASAAKNFQLNLVKLDSTINCTLIINTKSVTGNGTILPSDKLTLEFKMGELRNSNDSIPSPVYMKLTFISDSQAKCVYFDDNTKDSLRFILSENYASGSVSSRYFKETAMTNVSSASSQVTAAYPEIFANNPETASKINQMITQNVFRVFDDSANVMSLNNFSEYSKIFQDDFRHFVEESPNDTRNENSSWYEESYFYITYNDNNLLSLQMLSGSYTGGAHPNSSIMYLNIDTRTGDKIELSDIIEAINISKLNAIGEEIFRSDNELDNNADLDTAGYWLKNNTFELNENFMLMPDGLLFTFVPYEISSYARGYIDIFIPYEKIADIIKDDSPVRVFLNKGNQRH